MNWEDPPEPTEDEMNEYEQEQAVKNAPTVSITGITAEAVQVIVRETVRGQLHLDKRVSEAIDEAVGEAVSKALDATIRERMSAAVDAAIVDGFPIYDRYSGRETGRTSIAEMVHKALSERTDSYDNKGTLAERAVRKAVDALFTDTLKGELTKVTAEFKRQADEVFKAKLVAGMKEAIGLRS